MTKSQYTKKVNGLIATAARDMRARAQIVLKSGAIDLPSASNGYTLPKAVISVLLQSVAFSYRPLSRECKKIASNLKHFV